MRRALADWLLPMALLASIGVYALALSLDGPTEAAVASMAMGVFGLAC